MKSYVGTNEPSVVFLHSSNEMYGADKILLDVLQSLPASARKRTEVWLPDDIPSSDRQLSGRLQELGVSNRVAALPVLRRRYLTVRGAFPLISRVWRTYRDLKRAKPDVAYCTTSAMVFCLPIAKLARVKRVVLHLQEIWAPREATVLGLAAEFADKIVCISRAARESLPKRLHQRSRLLLNAHRPSASPLVPLETLRGPLRFLIASRWNGWKGHFSLLSAWNQDTCPGELIILGGPPSMGTGVDVEALVRNLRHSSSVSVIGEVNDIAGYIDQADFLVLPSDRPEPFGLVLVEAFARGRPVIASRAGGVVDIVRDGHNGLLFEMGDELELRRLLNNVDRASAAALGNQAKLDFEDKFSIESFELRLRELWPEIVEER
ncbi:glycosyltransferase [Paenarthrobacter sp. TAF1]|uniref:glycosyltransferase n=1 Tax=Paenarthrobacter sp. TAF1 TaxID=3233067 RepID=UPI003F968842